MAEIDWQLLERTAISAMESAYAPYSKFPVGVAALEGTAFTTTFNAGLVHPVALLVIVIL